MESGKIKRSLSGKKELKKKKRRKEAKPLNIGIFKLLVFGWLLPLMIMSVTIFSFVSQKMIAQTENEIQDSANTAVDICGMRINASIQSSRDASYIPKIRQYWKNYLIDGNGQKLYDGVYEFLSQMYKYDENFLNTIVYFWRMPSKIFYTSSNTASADYDSVLFFTERAMTEVDELAKTLDTQIGFLCVEDHLYLVRNIVDKDFTPLATIVMELNKNVIFQSLKGIGWYEDACVFIDGECVYQGNGEALSLIHDMKPEEKKRSVYHEENGHAFVCRTKTLEGHEIRYAVQLNYEAIHYERNSMILLVILVLLFSVPLIGIIVWFLYSHVTNPVKRLVVSAHEIERGNFGYQIESEEKSEEFAYLTSAFNSMSDKLKNQFEQIYLEELALKDADIKALQSQINPHFLNNTLEIINWEARMNGNEKVSSMIEALSTMLEATLNRKRQPMIPLSEELQYVDAYCYIIKQRFGDKLQFEKKIDERLLKEGVPRLIIQPIIENAVEHGLCGRKGKIEIRIYREENMMKIEIVNDGELTLRDKERIQMLLNYSGDTDRSVSLGIRNVNKRLKIIYGPECGLTVENDKEGCTVSTLTVRIRR